MNIAIIGGYRNSAGGAETISKTLKDILESEKHRVDWITIEDGLTINGNNLLKKIIGTPYLTSLYFNSLRKKYDLLICNGEWGWGIRHPKCIILFHYSSLGYRNYTRKGLSLRELRWFYQRHVYPECGF